MSGETKKEAVKKQNQDSKRKSHMAQLVDDSPTQYNAIKESNPANNQAPSCFLLSASDDIESLFCHFTEHVHIDKTFRHLFPHT